ncbi:bcl-2-binding component 3, isoforms 3/4-like [Agelaius tricolor]|uniref:bcl-2-binding component 3, isoforms 3/4-like n=1 Tax=Agelaius tricolor TaxID=9191 RepID=UPI0039F255F7
MARASPAAASSRLLRCQSRAAAASRSSLPCEAMVARGAGRSLRGTARRGGETPPPAPPRPAPASARPPAGREPRHAESRPAPLRSEGTRRPESPAGLGGRGGRRLGERAPGSSPRSRPDVGGAGRADPPAGGRGGAAWGAPGRRRRCGPLGARLAPPARSLAAPSAGGGAAPRAGRAEGRGGERRRGRPARPRALRLRGETAPAPPSPTESLRVPPTLRPAETRTVGDASRCPVHLPPEVLPPCISPSLRPSIPLPAAGRPLRDARTAAGAPVPPG